MTLKEIRESRGMSQQGLANASGIPKRQIQAFEQGYRDINGAKLVTLLALSNVLNCEMDQIVTDEKTKQMIYVYMLRVRSNRIFGGDNK